MTTFRMAALGAALMIGMGATAQAQGTGDGRQGQRGAQMRAVASGPLFRGITLSDAQKSQLRAVGERYGALRQEMRKDAGGGAQAAGERQRPDSATRARMSDLMQKQQSELRAILTGDQQRTFDANVAQMRERGGDRVRQRGNGDGRPRGGEGRQRNRAGRGA